jgi:hypothetical protein
MDKIVIGVTLDDVVRDINTKFKELYGKRVIASNEIILKSSDKTEVVDGIESVIQCFENVVDDKEIDYEQIIDIYNLTQYFSSEEETIDYIYNDYVFDLYALSNETKEKIVIELNKINGIANDFNIELIIILKEFGKQRSSSLHFLAKTYCELSKVIFIDEYKDVFNYCNYIVTTNYHLFSDKRVIKVETEYNKQHTCDLTIKNISKLPELFEILK